MSDGRRLDDYINDFFSARSQATCSKGGHVLFTRRKQDDDLLYTARNEGEVTIRTRLCELCESHYRVAIYVDDGKRDKIEGLIVDGYLIGTDEYPERWFTNTKEDAEKMHEHVVQAFDEALLTRFEDAMRRIELASMEGDE